LQSLFFLHFSEVFIQQTLNEDIFATDAAWIYFTLENKIVLDDNASTGMSFTALRNGFESGDIRKLTEFLPSYIRKTSRLF